MGVMHACHYPGCMKKFDRKYNLKCHLRIHSNEKPYRCHHENCTRSFRWKSSLNHHLMSLDHTPAAVRRARKARAQRRRIARTAPQTFVPQPSLDHHHVFDLPTLSPVSSAATFSHSPSPPQRPVPDLSHSQPHHFKLDRRFNPSDLPASSVSPTSSAAPQDLHFGNRNPVPHTHHRDSIPNQPLPTHPPQYRPPPALLLRPGATPQSHQDPAPNIQPQPQPQPQPQLMAHIQDPLAMPVRPLQHPLLPEPALKAELRTFADDSPAPRRPSEAETSIHTIHTPADDTISLVTPTKKCDPLDFHSAPKVPMAAPLVSIFEELSPVSLMPFPSSLDSLFPASVEGSGMKIF